MVANVVRGFVRHEGQVNFGLMVDGEFASEAVAVATVMPVCDDLVALELGVAADGFRVFTECADAFAALAGYEPNFLWSLADFVGVLKAAGYVDQTPFAVGDRVVVTFGGVHPAVPTAVGTIWSREGDEWRVRLSGTYGSFPSSMLAHA